MKIIILLLLLLNFSCSTGLTDRRGNYRSTASFSSFAKSCKGLVGDIFNGTTKPKIKLVLDKLSRGEEISKSEAKKLLSKVHEIPFLNERVAIEKKLEAGLALSSKESKTVRNFIGRDIILGANTDKKLYQKQFFGGDESMPISYGLEFELTLKENPAILNSYRVKGYTEEDWYKLSLEDRLVIAKKAQIGQDDIDHFLLRLSNANPKLPEGLFVEPHGTIEGNDMVFDNLGDFHDLLTYFTEHFEAASFQSHVVFEARSELEGLAGYTIFEYDRAQIAALENGYRSYLKDESRTPAKNLIHHSLGPIDETIASKIVSYEENLASGNIDFRSQGTKAVFAPNFRVGTPYGEKKMGFELRQFHKRGAQMFDASAKLSNDLQNYGNLAHYKEFSETPQTSISTMREVLTGYGIPDDKLDDFELFFISLGDEITKDIKKVQGARGGATLENRLLYPLRDWMNHPVKSALNDSELLEFQTKTKVAQEEFIDEVLKLMTKYDVTEVNEEALKSVQVLIASWSQKADYSKFFHKFSSEVKGTKRDVKYSYLPELNFFNKVDDYIAKKTERVIPTYKFKNISHKNSEYKNYLDNSIEVIYRDIGNTGHIELRVGSQKYSINGYFLGSSSASSSKFSGIDGKGVGRVYRLDRSKIKEMNERVAEYIKSVSNNNFPPFDVWGGVEQVEKTRFGYKIVGKSKNKATIKAELVEEAGQKFFKKGNVKIPAIEKDGELHIQTTNCTHGVVDILKSYLDINLGNYPSAGMLDSAFSNDSVRVPYDAVVNY